MGLRCKITELFLSVDMADRAASHLKKCSTCRQRAKQARMADAILAERPKSMPRETVPRNLISSIRNPEPQQPSTAKPIWLLIPTAGLTVAIAVLILSPRNIPTPVDDSILNVKQMPAKQLELPLPAPTAAVSNLSASDPYNAEMSLIADDFRRLAGLSR